MKRSLPKRNLPKKPDVLPPLIEHKPARSRPGFTVCGLRNEDVVGRQAITDMPLPDRICLTCESIENHFPERA